jgi:hypothetical protein
MALGEEIEPRNRRNDWIQTAALSVAGALVLWLTIGDGIARVRAELSAPKPVATVVARHAPTPPSCSGTQLELGLSFTSCADSVDQAPYLCDLSTAGVFRGVVHLRDHQHTYLLSVEVDRGYHGPDVYPLVASPSATPTPGQAVARVALRETASGALWRSTAGWVRIDAGENSGSVRAGLVYDAAESSVLGLKTIGAWSCGRHDH